MMWSDITNDNVRGSMSEEDTILVPHAIRNEITIHTYIHTYIHIKATRIYIAIYILTYIFLIARTPSNSPRRCQTHHRQCPWEYERGHDIFASHTDTAGVCAYLTISHMVLHAVLHYEKF